MNRIRSLESLRGLLALWVVIGHTIKNSGYSDKDLGLMKLAAMPGLPVDVFIILSGFVIFFLLDHQRTSYSQFIVKRWFRLAPLFLVVLIVSAFCLGWQKSIIEAFPWKNTSILNNLTINHDALTYFPKQLLAHILMLHGAIADKFLPSSEYAFIGAAWSVSVEWQFYLIAPLLLALVVKKYWYRLGIVLLIVCVIRGLNYGSEGFAINQAGYFIVGIISYYIWKHCDQVDIEPQKLDLIAMVLAALIFLLLSRTVSLLIWIAVLSCVVAEKRRSFNSFQKWMSKVLHMQILQWLGKISYSVYLIHMLVFYFVAHLLMTLHTGISQRMFLAIMLPAVALATIAVSALTYRFFEQPGIAAGKKICLFACSSWRAQQ